MSEAKSLSIALIITRPCLFAYRAGDGILTELSADGGGDERVGPVDERARAHQQSRVQRVRARAPPLVHQQLNTHISFRHLHQPINGPLLGPSLYIFFHIHTNYLAQIKCL
jgi:hypothetical protein